jgi:ribosomal protein L37E
MACKRCGCRMPAHSINGLVCADCGTPFPTAGRDGQRYSWRSMAAVGCAALLTAGVFVVSSLSSDSPTLAETHQEAAASEAGAAE